MDNIEQGFLLLGSNNTNSGVVGSLSHSTKSGRLKRGKSASGRATSFNRPSSAAPTITSFPLSRKKVTSDDLRFLASPGAGDNLTPTKTSFPSSKYKVTSDDLRFLASPGAGDNLTIKDANLRRSLLETFISSEVNTISTRVDEAVHSFNSNHPLAIIENSGNGVASAVPHVSVVEVRSALEEVFRIIDDGIGDRNRVLFELQSGIGSIVSRIVLEDRAKTLQTANRRKAFSKTSSRRGSVSTIDDKVENRLQHVDEIIDRCYQTFTERQQKKGPSKEDIVALDSLIKEANDNIARDQLLGENSLNDEMEDDPGAPAFVLKSAMSGAALKDLITKSTKSTESIRIQLLSIFTTVTDLLRGNETAHAKILNELRLKLSMAESELVLLQKSLSESVDAIKDNEASLNSLINQLRLKDLALEKCTAQLQDSQRIVKKLEAENEFRKSVTEKHQSTTTQAPLQNDLNANLESKRAQETASRASIDAKASPDKIASQNQMQISDLQKRLSEAEARERALQSKLQSTTDALNQTKVEFAARISAITTTSTSTTSSSTAAAAAAATVSAKAPPLISSIDNSNVNKTDVDKEVKDLQSQVAMLKDKIRELEMKLRESDEERKSLKSSILSANSSQSLPISATDAVAATLSSSSSSSSTTAATVDKLSQQSSTVPENIKSDSTLISKALFEQEMLSAKRDADSSRKLTLELNSEIDRLRQQLLNAKRDSDSKKSSPVNDSQKKTKSSSAATQTDTEVDDHHVSDGNVRNPESPPSLKTPHNIRKSSPLSSPVHHDVHLSLKPIHRITEGVDRGVNASYSVVGASEDVDDTSLISTHRTERSTDQRVQYAPKGGSPSESPEHSGNISNGRPFSPSSASTALRDGSKTHVEEANRFKGASQSVPLQKSPDVLASEALSPENLQGLKDAIEILGRHLFVIRRFGGKTGSAYWTNESAPTLTFTDLISRIEDLHVRVSHPLQNLHTVLKSASDAHHGTPWMRSNAIRTSPIPDSMTFTAVEEPLTQSSPSTASLGSKSTAVPFAILQQALFTPSKQRSSLPRL
jgi:peptidoglycan hydrolase CwlO-like protein